jgi:hypothetical protein
VNDQTEPSTGNPTEPSSQALELTRWVWIALGLAALLGLSRGFRDQDHVRTLVSLDKENPVIVRLRGQTHVFPLIRIKVAAVEGWTYLSVTDDAMATQATFINESTNSIISLRQFRLRSWPPVEGEVTTRQYGDIAMEWVAVDHRRVGRITKETPLGEVDAIVMVMTHVRKSELNQSVEQFCQAIRWISSNDER